MTSLTCCNNEPWLVEDETGEHAIAVVKDIYAFERIFREIKTGKRIKDCQESAMALLGQVEFAPVFVQKNGTIKWKSGQFVTSDDATAD